MVLKNTDMSELLKVVKLRLPIEIDIIPLMGVIIIFVIGWRV